jgi:CDP-4-dehydro-6-deoxyglucose reductase, E1
MKKFSWPLNVNNFNFLDKLKICKFIIDPRNRWTQDKQVKQFEDKFANFVGCKYSVFVSSGSTANTLIAMYLKDNSGNKDTVVFPSTTWITSISPFIREGFTPKFIDVSLDDLSINLDSLEEYLMIHYEKVACVFVTSLLGFVPNIQKLQELQLKYNVKIMMDNCENTFGTFQGKNISKYFTSTTSTYFGHQLQSIEGGFIFTDSDEEYAYFLMARNHGMVRSILGDKSKYQNNLVDSRFDFNILGNNFRNTDLNSFVGQLDFERRETYISKRNKLYSIFKNKIDRTKFILPDDYDDRDHVPFSLPVICKNKDDKQKILNYCENKKIETRPIISGNLLRQTCLKHYDNYQNYPMSEFLNENGLYIGLYSKLSEEMILNFVNDINLI